MVLRVLKACLQPRVSDQTTCFSPVEVIGIGGGRLQGVIRLRVRPRKPYLQSVVVSGIGTFYKAKDINMWNNNVERVSLRRLGHRLGFGLDTFWSDTSALLVKELWLRRSMPNRVYLSFVPI